MNKKILSLALAGTIVLGSSTAFAANNDIRNKVTGENTALTDVLFNNDMFFEVAFNQENYTVEFNGNLYNLEEVQAKFEANPDIEMEEAVEDLESVGKAEEGLKVVEVSAINENYVVVGITAPVEDLLAQEVEVKNGAGVVVAVKPLDIAEGDETAEFEFVTAVKTADLVGVWTVNGQSYDLDLFNKLADFVGAVDQIQLHNALVELEIENVKAANMKEYFEAKQELTVTAEELTVADVQKLVDDVNAKSVDKDEEKAIVKAIVEAKEDGNQFALLQALQNDVFVRVNPEWVATTNEGYMAKIQGTETTVKAIQAVLDGSNDTIIKAELTDLTATSIKKVDLLEVKALIEAYATVDKDGKIIEPVIKTGIENIEVQLAVVGVLEATTPTAFKARVAALAELANTKTTTVVDMKNYVDANGKEYIAHLAKAATVKNTAASINQALIDVNADQAENLVKAVQDEAKKDIVDADKLVKVLNNLGVKQVAAGNKVLYAANTSFQTVATKDAAQTAVDTSNLAAVKGSTENTIIDKLNVFELDNIVEANAEDYAKSATTTSGAINLVTVGADNKATVANVKAAVTTVNKEVAENSDVKAINKAETAEEVKVALDGLAIAKYLDVTPSDRIFIAEEVLDARSKITTPTAIEFENKAAVEVAVDNAAVARTNAIAGVNILKLDSTLTEVANALLAVGHDSLTGKVNEPTANDTAIADKFITSLIDEDGALSLNFRSIADIRAVLSSL